MNVEEVAAAFAGAISSHDIEGLSELMTDDHVFIDSDGTEVRGLHKMRKGWREYFMMVPDFSIIIEKTLSRNDTVVFLGRSEGTFVQGGVLKPENHWSVPSAWRVAVRGRRVAVWQVYVNPEPLKSILERMNAE
jgi:hypothetical protein